MCVIHVYFKKLLWKCSQGYHGPKWLSLGTMYPHHEYKSVTNLVILEKPTTLSCYCHNPFRCPLSPSSWLGAIGEACHASCAIWCPPCLMCHLMSSMPHVSSDAPHSMWEREERGLGPSPSYDHSGQKHF